MEQKNINIFKIPPCVLIQYMIYYVPDKGDIYMKKAIDITGRQILVGDVVSSPSWDFGTTMRVVDISDGGFVLYLVRAFRGRKIFPLDSRDWRIVSR